MREQRLICGGVRLPGSEFCPPQERIQIICTDHSCKNGSENRCINEILTTDGKLSFDTLVREKKKKTTKLPKNIFYECITQTPFTPRTHRELSKRHSDKLFNRK